MSPSAWCARVLGLAGVVLLGESAAAVAQESITTAPSDYQRIATAVFDAVPKDFRDWKPIPLAIDGQPAMVYAAREGKWNEVMKMLEAGERPNVADRQGVTPLMLAAAQGEVAAVDALIKAGAAPGIPDALGRPAIDYAIANKRPQTVEALIRGGVPVDAALLAKAAGSRTWDIVHLVLERLPVRPWDSAGRIALQLAINEKNTERMRFVLGKHQGPVTPEGHREPLLAFAAAAGDVELTRLLLEAGADPNTTLSGKPEARFLAFAPQKILRHYLETEPAMHVLAIAAGLGRVEVVRLLLKSGADRSRTTGSKYRLIALNYAAWGGHVECMQALIVGAPTPRQWRIEVDLDEQQATLFKDNIASFTTEISSGRDDARTPPGRYVITDKKTYHVSNIYKVKMPFFMRLSCKDFGLHEGHLPGYPASAGCIRLPEDAAKKLFRSVPIGTLVEVR